jgi:hypothetical protein
LQQHQQQQHANTLRPPRQTGRPGNVSGSGSNGVMESRVSGTTAQSPSASLSSSKPQHVPLSNSKSVPLTADEMWADFDDVGERSNTAKRKGGPVGKTASPLQREKERDAQPTAKRVEPPKSPLASKLDGGNEKVAIDSKQQEVEIASPKKSEQNEPNQEVGKLDSDSQDPHQQETVGEKREPARGSEANIIDNNNEGEDEGEEKVPSELHDSDADSLVDSLEENEHEKSNEDETAESTTLQSSQFNEDEEDAIDESEISNRPQQSQPTQHQAPLSHSNNPMEAIKQLGGGLLESFIPTLHSSVGSSQGNNNNASNIQLKDYVTKEQYNMYVLSSFLFFLSFFLSFFLVSFFISWKCCIPD